MDGASTSNQGKEKGPSIDDVAKEKPYDLEKQVELTRKTFQEASHAEDTNSAATNRTPVAVMESQKISMVPNNLKKENSRAYEPKVVSIGPYHHGKQQFASMENHKERAMQTLAKASKVTTESYKVEMRKVVQELKESYVDLDKDAWEDDDKFIWVMIRDGCFLIEFLSSPLNFFKNYSASDPIFGKLRHRLNYNDVMRDLQMVENQLPCLALKTLWSEHGKGIERDAVAISQWISGTEKLGFHMLDTCMQGLLEKGKGSIHEDIPMILCASDFDQYNVLFQKAETYNDMLFNAKTGSLTLPSIIIDEHTVSTYLNMVMRAHTYALPATSVFIIYAQLMGTLVQSSEDVRLLQSNGIIINKLMNNHDDVVEVIQEISKGTICPDHDLENNHGLSHNSVLEGLNEFCQKKTNRSKKTLNVWVSTLRETYFKTPWSGISLAAAIALLGLTVTQTVYAILSYKKEN